MVAMGAEGWSLSECSGETQIHDFIGLMSSLNICCWLLLQTSCLGYLELCSKPDNGFVEGLQPQLCRKALSVLFSSSKIQTTCLPLGSA